jgi:chromosome partitioning protein
VSRCASGRRSRLGHAAKETKGNHMRIAVVSRQGGAGRTTTAVLLASWLATQGRTVLADLDFYPWAYVRTRRSRVAFEVVTADNDVTKCLARLAEEPTHLVLDTPSHDEIRPRAALAVADAALVPTRSAPLDVWSLRHTSRMVRDARNGRPPPTWVLQTMVRDPAASLLTRKSIEQDDLVGFPVLEAVLSWRTAYEAPGCGPNRFSSMQASDWGEIAEVGQVLMDHLNNRSS